VIFKLYIEIWEEEFIARLKYVLFQKFRYNVDLEEALTQCRKKPTETKTKIVNNFFDGFRIYTNRPSIEDLYEDGIEQFNNSAASDRDYFLIIFRLREPSSHGRRLKGR